MRRRVLKHIENWSGLCLLFVFFLIPIGIVLNLSGMERVGDTYHFTAQFYIGFALLVIGTGLGVLVMKERGKDK